MGNKIGRRRQVVDEKYTKPQGLYEHRDIDHKKLRKLILESKLAPCYPGDEESSLDLEECPICFLYYPSLNRSKCCMKGICTECFLQMKPTNSNRPTQCPFCKTPNYAVEYRGVKSNEEKSLEQVEEQRVIEAQIRMRQQEIQDEEERFKKKQEKQCSSSRILSPPSEVDYRDFCTTSLSVPSFRRTTHGNDFVSSQPSCSAHPSMRLSHSRHNRDDNIDLDLEEVMFMEAIWLSIQEQGNNTLHPVCGPSNNMLIDPYSFHTPNLLEAPSVGGGGGFSCSVAAMHPPINYPSIVPANLPPPPPSFNMIQRPGLIHPATIDMCTMGNPSITAYNSWIEVSPNWRREVNGEDGDQWSDAAEAGTSYAGSDIVLDVGPGPMNLPEGFHHPVVNLPEERMMLSRANPPGLAWM